jgi:hypothetical protein
LEIKMNELTELKDRFEAVVQSNEEFPISFDEAWQWAGYTRKDSALRMLTANFKAGSDFCSTQMRSKNTEIVGNGDFCCSEMSSKNALTDENTKDVKQKSGRGGHNVVEYYLTAECFKSFCMMTGTEKGKEVRQYYLQIEKAWNNSDAVVQRALRILDQRNREAMAAYEIDFFPGSPSDIKFSDMLLTDMRIKIDKLCKSLDRIEDKETQGYASCKRQAHSIRASFPQIGMQLALSTRAYRAQRNTAIEMRRRLTELGDVEPPKLITASP